MKSDEYPLAILPPNREIDPWVATMLSVDLGTRRHVLKRFKPTPMPPFLYKYFSSNGPYSHRNLRDVIVGSVLRLNPPSGFNDPFEMRAHFVMTGTEEESGPASNHWRVNKPRTLGGVRCRPASRN